MCDFFSLISDGFGRVYYFTAQDRRRIVAEGNPERYGFDSHASIAEFHHIDEDTHNKWELDPISGVLKLDMQNAAYDRRAVLSHCRQIDFKPLGLDVEGIRGFLSELKGMKWLRGRGAVPDGVKMYDDRAAALAAATAATKDSAMIAACDAACKAAVAAARAATRNVAWDAVRDAVWDTMQAAIRRGSGWCGMWDVVGGGVRDATLVGCLRYVCFDLSIDRAHIEHAEKRLSVWKAGYGVACDVDGVLYCYRGY